VFWFGFSNVHFGPFFFSPLPHFGSTGLILERKNNHLVAQSREVAYALVQTVLFIAESNKTVNELS
jgi:hypothetical protein